MPTSSLRERKRVQTWTDLHEAASELAMSSDALALVTIDAIVERANVSPRTFFNYFDTKEDAILGFREPRITASALSNFAASTSPLLSRVADFYFDVVNGSRTSGPGKRRRRHALIRRHPELASRQLTHFLHAEELVRSAVRAHLEADQVPDGFTADELVEVLLAASNAAHRTAAWLARTGRSGADDRAAMHHVLSQLREVSHNNL